MSRTARDRALGGVPRRRRIQGVRLLVVLTGLAIAAAGVPGWVADPSSAASGTGDGSDWSSTGLTHSASAQTVRWDNTGNPAADVVHRDGRQELPHTGGQTYDAISPSVVSSYFTYFGADNGLGGLKVKVSQTQDLVNQSVTLDISGVKGGTPYGIPSSVFLQVFQCWGGLTASGAPDPDASDPDPATCQTGAGDAASRASGLRPPDSRYINTDSMALGGDWAKYYNKGGDLDVPFTAINGQRSGSTNGARNQFFNPATTNEISEIQVSPSGTATRQFELQTSLESAGLGCGLRRGQTSTRSCWLVVVPRINNVLNDNGPISPSLWAQRLQVKLGFRDIVAGCPGGQDRTLMVGSELLATAAASWTPGLCDANNIALGYTQIGDPVARAEFTSGAAEAVLTTQPADKSAVYAPVALAAPVIAYQLSYQPFCPATLAGYTEDEARNTCGYASLADLNADIARAGTLVRNLKLDARLVAKLLTQSYAFAIFDQQGFRRSGWMVHRPSSLASDPEFRRLNPDLDHISVTGSAINNLDHLLLEALRSDAASQVWSWILQDPDARAFIDGCPDGNGTVINPFYSTRTYTECPNQRDALSKQADLDRATTPTPASYVDLALTYPPDGSPYPLPGWQEATTADTAPFSVYDFLPRVDSMPVAGRDVAIGYLPRNSSFCLTSLDSSCTPAPGVWKDPKTRQAGDRLGAIAITTSATAARFQLPTAQLCDTTGAHCVGADTASLQKAAGRFIESSADGVLEPGSTDYAAGAYPLTMPVYAGVSKSLAVSQRRAYANALEYVTTTGQKPGFAPGNLPAGYAPLTAPLRSMAKSAIADLRKATPTTKPTATATSPSNVATAVPPALQPSTAPAPAAAAGPHATVELTSPQFQDVSASGPSFPRWPLPLGLAIAVIAALAGPALRLRSTFKVGNGVTTTYLPEYPASGTDDARARSISVAHAPVDRVFRSVARSGGTFVLLVMSLIGIFLTVKAVTAVKSEGIVKFVTTQQWSPETNHFGIAAILPFTVTIAVIALVVSVPLSLGAALFITEVASGRLRSVLTGTIDLMAAVPSVIYGVWGLSYLQNHIVPFSLWLSKYFGWIPIFHVDGVENNGLSNPALYTSSSFIGGLVVGMMIVPIQTSMMREAFSRAPQGEREGAYALGATRWGMVRSVVIPYGMGGIIGGTMLGLGRALGETIALYLIISPVFDFNLHVLQNGSNSVAVTIALRYGEANPFTMSALMALGLSLFLLTMAINFTASAIIARSRSGAESEG